MANNDDLPKSDSDEIPEHLRYRPGLFVRQGLQIVEASPEDQMIAQSYPAWNEKGPLVKGRRITLMIGKATFDLNEEIHVIHVYEVVVPGHLAYVMGPKPVYGEYLDGVLVTPNASSEEVAFKPQNYDGRALPSPAVDFNFEITSYLFSKPDHHQIDWRVGGLRSNTLKFEVARNE